jgi:nitrite reductase/ring-hydroxylating ferredoxin subunit
MGFLDKLFGRKGDKEAPTPTDEAPPAAAVSCPHKAVTPRWDSGADMGKMDLVSAYVCEACGARFSREEGETLTGAAADRLRVSDETRREGMQR